jgi:hypothetical protein
MNINFLIIKLYYIEVEENQGLNIIIFFFEVGQATKSKLLHAYLKDSK